MLNQPPKRGLLAPWRVWLKEQRERDNYNASRIWREISVSVKHQHHTTFELSSYLTGGNPFGIRREDQVIHLGNTGLIFLYQLWFEGTVTITQSTQFQKNVASDKGISDTIVVGVSSQFGLIVASLH